jgi:hypothetical protein
VFYYFNGRGQSGLLDFRCWSGAEWAFVTG